MVDTGIESNDNPSLVPVGASVGTTNQRRSRLVASFASVYKYFNLCKVAFNLNNFLNN